MPNSKVDARTLTGVSETTLWTLYCRAHEASRSAPLIDDPLAVQLMDQIDYDFRKFEQVGIPKSLQKALRPTTQHFAVRALSFDRVIQDFLRKHPHGTVVALAEGLQTTFWRINSPTVRWISLDLPAVISLRKRLLPPSPQITHLTASALVASWHQHLDPQTPILITAEGLDSATTIPYAQGRGFRGKMQTVLPKYPVLSHLTASITLLQFRPTP